MRIIQIYLTENPGIQKDNVEDVVQFTRLASQARTMETLLGSDFPDIITSGQPVIIDFFAPWCPPCMNFLPEFRRASTMIGGQVAFGTVDCTIHSRVCNQHNIRSYPSTIFFNNSKPHKYQVRSWVYTNIETEL